MAVPGITNSEGAEASWGSSRVALAASNGFTGALRALARTASRSRCSPAPAPAWSATTTIRASCTAAISSRPRRSAGAPAERTVRRLNPRKIETDEAAGRLRPARRRAACCATCRAPSTAPSIARGTSFLKARWASASSPRPSPSSTTRSASAACRSKPVDGEGIAPKRRAIIEKGVLTTWLLDLRSARQLKLKSTGHAARGTTSPPSPSLDQPLHGAGQDDARGADRRHQGRALRDRVHRHGRQQRHRRLQPRCRRLPHRERQARPIRSARSRSPAACCEMFQRIVAADDLEFRYGVDAPTLMIDGMTIAGL